MSDSILYSQKKQQRKAPKAPLQATPNDSNLKKMQICIYLRDMSL